MENPLDAFSKLVLGWLAETAMFDVPDTLSLLRNVTVLVLSLPAMGAPFMVQL